MAWFHMQMSHPKNSHQCEHSSAPLLVCLLAHTGAATAVPAACSMHILIHWFHLYGKNLVCSNMFDMVRWKEGSHCYYHYHCYHHHPLFITIIRIHIHRRNSWEMEPLPFPPKPLLHFAIIHSATFISLLPTTTSHSAPILAQRFCNKNATPPSALS